MCYVGGREFHSDLNRHLTELLLCAKSSTLLPYSHRVTHLSHLFDANYHLLKTKPFCSIVLEPSGLITRNIQQSNEILQKKIRKR